MLTHGAFFCRAASETEAPFAPGGSPAVKRGREGEREPVPTGDSRPMLTHGASFCRAASETDAPFAPGGSPR